MKYFNLKNPAGGTFLQHKYSVIITDSQGVMSSPGRHHYLFYRNFGDQDFFHQKIFFLAPFDAINVPGIILSSCWSNKTKIRDFDFSWFFQWFSLPFSFTRSHGFPPWGKCDQNHSKCQNLKCSFSKLRQNHPNPCGSFF